MSRGQEVSQGLRDKVDTEVQEIITRCYEMTVELITNGKEHFDAIAELLMKQETILGPQWEALFKDLEEPRREQKEMTGYLFNV